MSRIAYDEVIISDRGGGNPRRLPIANVACSWEFGNAGSFSGFVQMRDLRAAGLGTDLDGGWLTWDGGDAGAWGGVITGRPVESGVAEISALGWAALLRGRIVVAADYPPPGPAAGLARRLLANAGVDEPTYITIGTLDEGSETVALALNGGDIADDLLPQLAESGGIEWLIDSDRRLQAGRRIGTDRSASVRLAEGIEIADYRLDNDLWSAKQGQIYGLEPAEQRNLRQTRGIIAGTRLPTTTIGPAVQLVQPDHSQHDSPIGPGLLQFVVEVADTAFGGDATAPAPLPAWAGQRPGIGANHPGVASYSDRPAPTVPMQLTVTNHAHCWAKFGLGDTVRVELGSCGFAGYFRVMSRALDVASQAMALGGESLIATESD